MPALHGERVEDLWRSRDAPLVVACDGSDRRTDLGRPDQPPQVRNLILGIGEKLMLRPPVRREAVIELCDRPDLLAISRGTRNRFEEGFYRGRGVRGGILHCRVDRVGPLRQLP